MDFKRHELKWRTSTYISYINSLFRQCSLAECLTWILTFSHKCDNETRKIAYLLLNLLTADVLGHSLYPLRSTVFGIAIWSYIRKIETLLKTLFRNKSNWKCNFSENFLSTCRISLSTRIFWFFSLIFCH